MTLLAWLVLIGALVPQPALAHVAIQGVGGFAGGFLHPLLVPSHALGLVALGLFVGQQPARRVALAIFAVALLAGLGALALAVGETPAENVLLANTALLGVLLAAAWAPPRPIVWMLAAITGAALALDSPPQAITIEESNVMLLGTAIGALGGLTAVTAATGLAKQNWNRLGVRILGSWIAASAVLVLSLALAR